MKKRRLSQELIEKLILDELERAEKKHPTWPKDKFRALAVIQEELGEATRALLHLEYEKGNRVEVFGELIQTGAMVMRFLKNFDVDFRVKVEGGK